MAEHAEQWARRASSARTVTTCRRNARTWLVESAGSTAVVPHSVGMDYLAQLIEHADVEIPAVELASGYGVTCRGAACEPVLDDEAKAQYRHHMRELRAELDDAEACADIERAARARVALDRVIEELERAAGFGGRTRTFADNAERARLSVRKAIRRAVEMIKEAEPTLGRAIDSRVVTGMRCVFVTHSAD